MSETRILRFYRQDAAGQRVLWEVELDNTNTAVREEPAKFQARAHRRTGEEMPANVIPEDATPALRRQLETIRERGISFRLNERGGIDLFDYPELELRVGRFFNTHEPCFFDGCEEMRKAYHHDVEMLEAGSNGCDIGCARTKLDNQYGERVRQLLKQHEQFRVGGSGDQSVSSSGDAPEAGAGQVGS